MILFFILIFFLFVIITTKVKIEINNIHFDSQTQKHLARTYKIILTLKIFYIIPILRLKIDNKKVKEILKNQKIKNTIQKEKLKIVNNKAKINKQQLKAFKKLKLDIKNLDLKIVLGTEDSALTAFIIPVASTFIAIFLHDKIKKYNKNQKFEIKPIYINKNLINIEFSGIFQIKLMHIINTIFILNKKGRGDKHERTSYRRTYEYGYE